MDKKETNKIVEEHLKSVTKMLRQVARENLKEMKGTFCEKHWNYQHKLHEQFIDKSINKTMQRIQSFLADIIFSKEANDYGEQMAENNNSQISQIMRIKKLAQQISNMIKQERINECQQEIKLKLPEIKQSSFPYVPRLTITSQQDQNYQARIAKLAKRLSFYEQRYDKDSCQPLQKEYSS